MARQRACDQCPMSTSYGRHRNTHRRTLGSAKKAKDQTTPNGEMDVECGGRGPHSAIAFSFQVGFGVLRAGRSSHSKSDKSWHSPFYPTWSERSCLRRKHCSISKQLCELGLLWGIGTFATSAYTSSDMDFFDNYDGILMILSNTLRSNSTVNLACLLSEALLRNRRQRPGIPSEAFTMQFVMAPSSVIIRVIPWAYVVYLSAIPSSAPTVVQARQEGEALCAVEEDRDSTLARDFSPFVATRWCVLAC